MLPSTSADLATNKESVQQQKRRKENASKNLKIILLCCSPLHTYTHTHRTSKNTLNDDRVFRKSIQPQKGDICQDNTDLRRCSLKSRTENKMLRVFLVTINELSSTSSFIFRIVPGTISALSSSNFPGISPVQAKQQKEQAHT